MSECCREGAGFTRRRHLVQDELVCRLLVRRCRVSGYAGRLFRHCCKQWVHIVIYRM